MGKKLSLGKRKDEPKLSALPGELSQTNNVLILPPVNQVRKENFTSAVFKRKIVL